nr:proline-serine-threonine phosphatase-interacting protein 2 isoform X1 [Pogona vitticeps]XP_020662207.1 proline-serine-threonine phosphatase-interacting protein 2 isoform X2 [Pogona vitticeps]
MRETLFKDNFWSTDLVSTAGYNNIIQHLNDGRKNCKEFEDFLKERASIEERYGKDLINLTRKKPCGQTELNTLKRALEVFKQQVDSVGQSHIQLAQTLREEARKMEDFREKQKFHRKKIELIMDAIHKNRNLQYKKTLEAKRLYEQRCRDKDEAEQAVHRSANLVIPKQQEKLFVKLAQTKTALEDSDRVYQMNIGALEKIREEWQMEHVKACEFFESQECERINYFRNALWLHVNQLSEECVKNDDSYEEIRKSLEHCSIEKDIECFVSLRKTGSLPPTPVVYENYYNTQKNAALGRNQAPAPGRRPQMPVPSSKPMDPEYSTVDGYSLIHHP